MFLCAVVVCIPLYQQLLSTFYGPWKHWICLNSHSKIFWVLEEWRAIITAPASIYPGMQLENITRWGKNILRRGKRTVGEYTKYNKINNNSENFRGARMLLGVLSSLSTCKLFDSTEGIEQGGLEGASIRRPGDRYCYTFHPMPLISPFTSTVNMQ